MTSQEAYKLGVQLAVKTAASAYSIPLWGLPATTAAVGATEGAYLSPEGERLVNALRGGAEGALSGAGALTGLAAHTALVHPLLTKSKFGLKNPRLAAALTGLSFVPAMLGGSYAGRSAAEALGVGNLRNLEAQARARDEAESLEEGI